MFTNIVGYAALMEQDEKRPLMSFRKTSLFINQASRIFMAG
jgi:hypothetical protein